ncbi:MAG: hypothetical protein AB1762_17300 [Gemmatimonadota bacterium]
MPLISFRGLLIASLLSAGVASAQTRGFTAGNYSFLPRTAAFDPQFDAWRVQVAADSFRVFDPSGAVFLVSLSKMAGDTLVWTDVMGPCTGVVSRYVVSRDTVGVKLDLIDDACTDRANVLPNIYFAPAKASGGEFAAEPRRRYTKLRVLGYP